jgi:hypothetical protein
VKIYRFPSELPTKKDLLRNLGHKILGKIQRAHDFIYDHLRIFPFEISAIKLIVLSCITFLQQKSKYYKGSLLPKYQRYPFNKTDLDTCKKKKDCFLKKVSNPEERGKKWNTLIIFNFQEKKKLRFPDKLRQLIVNHLPLPPIYRLI